MLKRSLLGLAFVLTSAVAAVLFYPLGVSIAPVRAVDPAAVSPQLHAAFQAERNMTGFAANQLLSGSPLRPAMQRHMLAVALFARLSIFATPDQIATFVAQEAFFLPSPNGALTLAEVTQQCFGKAPQNLSADEAAVLVAIARNPGRYSQGKNDADLLEWRDRTLRAMADLGALSPAELETAVAEPLDNCTE